MDTRSAALIILYVVVGFFIYVWLAIPAGTGWDEKIHWGDVAGWVSGIGSLLAAATSVGIAVWSHKTMLKREARAEASLASILAVEAQEIVASVVTSMWSSRLAYNRLTDGRVNEFLIKSLTVGWEDQLVELIDRSRTFEALPQGVREAIVRLRYSVKSFNGTVSFYANEIADAEGDLEACREVAKHLSGPFEASVKAARQVVEVLGKYNSEIAAIRGAPTVPWSE